MENKSSMVARPSGPSIRWPRACDGDRARGVQGVPRDAQGARRAGNKMKIKANIKTGDLVRPAPYTHIERSFYGSSGLVLKEDWRKSAPLLVMWKGDPRSNYWHRTNELVLISESW